MSKRSQNNQNRRHKATASAALACAVVCAPSRTPYAAAADQHEGDAQSAPITQATPYPSLTAFAGFGVGAEEIVRFPYNPALDVACGICKVPYGEVGVGGAPDFVRSHEIHLFDNDACGFIPRKQARMERYADRDIFEGWDESYAARLAADEAHRADLACACRCCEAVRTAEGAALRDAWNEWADAHMKDKPFLQILFAGYGSDADIDTDDMVAA